MIVTAGHVHPGGLWTDLKLQRGARTAELFRSVADYFDPSGPVSWDMAMTVTPPSWKVAVDKGDTLKVSATYDTRRASWYEVMGIMLVYMVDDRSGAADPFGHDFPTRGAPTHGQLKEATNFGGGPSGKPDPTTLPGAQAFGGRVGIADFAYLPGDQFSALTTPAPPVVQAGQSLDFANLDEMGSVLHTVTACRAPCNGATGISYPLADGPVDFDSGELGYGPKGYTAASNRGDWQTPKNLPSGTYTYFCRVHPFMRGSFRVVDQANAAAGSSTSPSRARARSRVTVVRVRHGVARVRVGCRRAGEACRGRLMARWRGRTVATARFAIPPRRTRAVAMRLTRAGRAALRSRRRLAVRLTVRGRGTARSRLAFVAVR